MFEVILLLESDTDDAHNPHFAFEEFDDAKNMLKELVFQGYSVAIYMLNED